MTNIFLRAWNWCCRFRHRCGYGVHSPSDFFLITYVIYERLPYYAYVRLRELRRKMEHLPHYREKVDKLLLRLVNYLRPSLLLEFGTGSGINTRYLAAGSQQMDIITTALHCQDEVGRFLSDDPRIKYCEGNVEDLLRVWKEADTSAVLVHIAHTPHYQKIFEKLIPLVGEKTCFLIGSPYADEAKRRWWKSVIADERTGVTFDLYDIGLVFFDKGRVKEHRVVNFL